MRRKTPKTAGIYFRILEADYEKLSGLNYSAICQRLLADWLNTDGNDDLHRQPYYAGRETKRVGFRVEPDVKRAAEQKAGWRQLGLVMSNLLKAELSKD